MTVYRVDGNGAETPSREWAECSLCKTQGLRGDFPGEGGIVPNANGRLLCDFCAGLLEAEDAA
jgi:hypothetical protein